MANIGTYCDVHSRTFQVNVTAHFQNLTRQYVGIVWRDSPQDVRIVGFYWQQAEASADTQNDTQNN
jgi:hypothetical protein